MTFSVSFCLFLGYWFLLCDASLGDGRCPRVGVFRDGSWTKDEMIVLRKELSDVELSFHDASDTPLRVPALHVFVSVGRKTAFSALKALANHDKIKWLHYQNASAIRLDHVYYRFFYSHMGFVHPSEMAVHDIDLVSASEYFSGFPMVSIFSATFRSGEKIWRLINSVRNQTFRNWEIVFVDDSNDSQKTFRELSRIKDPRIRVYLPHESGGIIGAMKRYAAGLCRGHILVEMDHDDALEPTCLEEIVEAYVQNPKAGFVYGDYTEWFLENNSSNTYPEGYARGFGAYYRQYSNVLRTWVSVAREPDINTYTLRDIVGYPNHVRTWRADFYAMIGGHNIHLPVADDVELLMRTFLRTQMVRIPRLGYIQYRERNGNNFTFLRLEEIRKLQRRLALFYSSAINKKLKALGMRVDHRRMSVFYRHQNKTDVQMMANAIHAPKRRRILILTISSNRVLDVAKSSFDEVVVVGYRGCSLACLDSQVATFQKLGRQVRYWALQSSDTQELAVWYGSIIAESMGDFFVMDGSNAKESNQFSFFRPMEAKRNWVSGTPVILHPCLCSKGPDLLVPIMPTLIIFAIGMVLLFRFFGTIKKRTAS